MKAVKIIEPGKVVVDDLPIAEPGRDEIRIKLKYVGFCGSDLSTYLGKNPMVQYPRIPGHEISGIIDKTGEDVPENFRIGEKVTVVPYTSCGQCSSCRRGREYACRYNQTLGVQRDGAMLEFLSIPWNKVLKAPELSEIELAMVEPLTVGFHAVDRGSVDDNDVVMVLGCGMIGSGAIIRSALRGARVIAVDIDDYKLELAAKLGADDLINSQKMNVHEEVQKITGGLGPDVIIEAAGNPVTYKMAVDEVAFTGRVVCIGYAAKDVQFATKLFVQKEIDIRGSRNATARDFRAVISYLQRGEFPIEQMITKIIDPEEVDKSIGDWAADSGKVMKILLKL